MSRYLTTKEAHAYLQSKAKELGIDLESLATETRELSLESFNHDLSQITQASQGGIGIRVIKNGKTGYASTEELSQDALDWVIKEASENAELQTDTTGFLPKSQALGYKDILSEGLSAPLEEKANAVLELEKVMREDTRTKQVSTSRYSEKESQISLASTQGADGGYRNGYSILLGSLIMQQDKSLKQGFEYQLEKDFHALEPGKTALNMIEKTARQLGAQNLKTGRYTAYFEPKAFAQMMGLLLFMLNAKNVAEGKSRFADKLGKQVASSLISVIDDPNLEKGKANRPFDSEGTPTERLSLIEAGVLKSFLHNSQTAKELGQANTGHASRSYQSSLGISPSNLFLEAGSGVQATNGVIVTDLMGFHAGANPISGDFSLQAFGLKVQDDHTQAVENFAISGNILDLLNNISAVGNALEWSAFGGLVGSPMVEVQDLSFAGE